MSLEERRIDVRESRLGKVFSREYIPSSTSICAIEGQLISFKETLLSGEGKVLILILFPVNKQEDYIQRNIVLVFIINQLQYKIAI